jgi:hypothetical protein
VLLHSFFPLASEVCAKLFRHIPWENVCRVDGHTTEVKHTQNLFLFSSSINLYSATRRLLPLMARRIVFVYIRCCRVTLAFVTLFGYARGVGSGTRCAIRGRIPVIFLWSAGLGIIPRIDGVGSNRTRHDRNNGHGSLMQVDLIAKCKCLQDRKCTFQCACIEPGDRASVGHDITIPKISGEIGKAVEDLLKETVIVPMKQRHQANVIQPTYSVWIDDYGNKCEKDLMEDWLRLIIGTDSGDNHVLVDAKTGEIHHGVHSTNASNRSLSLGLMRVGKVHDVLRCSFDLAQKLLFNKNFIPLRKKSKWFY